MSFQGVVKRRPQRTTNSALRYSADRDISPKENGFAYSSRDDSQYYSGSEAANAPRVDLTKLKLQALRKYAKVYEIPHTATTGKEEMASLISKHWDKMVVSEEQVLQNLLRVRGRH